MVSATASSASCIASGSVVGAKEFLRANRDTHAARQAPGADVAGGGVRYHLVSQGIIKRAAQKAARRHPACYLFHQPLNSRSLGSEVRRSDAGLRTLCLPGA